MPNDNQTIVPLVRSDVISEFELRGQSGRCGWIFPGNQPTLKSRPKDTESSCSLPLGQACDRSEPFWINSASRSAQPDTLCPGPCQTGLDPFLNPRPLEFSQRSEDVKLQFRCWRRAVDPLRIERRQMPGVTRLGRRLLIRSASLLEFLDEQRASSLLEDQR